MTTAPARSADPIEAEIAGGGVLTPPWTERPDGGPRRVGVEIECVALDVRRAADLVQARFGGALEERDPYRFALRGARHGDFTIELDTQYAHPAKFWDEVEVEEDWLKELVSFLRDVDAGASRVIGQISEDFVPMEIVSPPIPWSALDEMTPLYHSIRQAGASGTDEGALYAFGLHLNPEVASLEADWLTDVLRAYILLSAWLRRSIDVDLMRRLLPYVDPFPKSYALQVVDPDYRPDQTLLIDDYLAENPTRNRELDMLPIFAELDGPRVRRAVDDDRIKPRPAFHYRLPNTRFTGTEDGPVSEWNRWVLVERLAADRALAAEMAAAFLDHYDSLIPGDWGAEDWAQKSDPFVRRLIG